MIGCDTRIHLGGAQSSFPDVAALRQAAWHQPQPASQSMRFVSRPPWVCSVIKPVVAFSFVSVQIDPGARRALDEHRFFAPCSQRNRIDMPVFQMVQLGDRQPDNRLHRRWIFAPGMRDGKYHRAGWGNRAKPII